MGRYILVGIILLIVSLFSTSVSAQKEDFEEFIHQDKLYKTGSSWFTIGSGVGYFPTFDRQQRNFMVDFNGRIKKNYFTLGFHYDGDNFITVRSGQRFYEFHGGYGWRSENLKRNIYAYLGPGYAMGYVFKYSRRVINTENRYEQTIYQSFNTLSLYGEVQYVRKVFYDIGMGAAFYASLNKHYQTVGVRLFMYFSTAYIDDI